ncbi:MAG: hypothetical protein K2Y21_16195 [Phycisphaerales bacterium]|nr:hypothetical protein [Phycisphaerales bacterium]
MFRQLFGFGAKKRIRKYCPDITPEEWNAYPAWEFCIDEEGVPGQDEATMRPLVGAKRVQFPQFGGVVATDFRSACGKTYFGFVEPGDGLDDGWKADPTIVLPAPARVETGNSKLDAYNQIVSNGHNQIRFYVPAMQDDVCRPYMDVAYRILETSADQMWPLRITPRIAIGGYPESWEIDGWLRYRGVGGKRHVIR